MSEKLLDMRAHLFSNDSPLLPCKMVPLASPRSPCWYQYQPCHSYRGCSISKTSGNNIKVALHTIIRFKELTGSRIEVLQFKIIWSFQGHAKSFCMPLPPPQDIFRETSRTSTHISKVEQLCIILLYQRCLQKETEEILLTRNSSHQKNHIHHKPHCSESFTDWFSQLLS